MIREIVTTVLWWAVQVTGGVSMLAGLCWVLDVLLAYTLRQGQAYWMFVRFVQWRRGKALEPALTKDPEDGSLLVSHPPVPAPDENEVA